MVNLLIQIVQISDPLTMSSCTTQFILGIVECHNINFKQIMSSFFFHEMELDTSHHVKRNHVSYFQLQVNQVITLVLFITLDYINIDHVL